MPRDISNMTARGDSLIYTTTSGKNRVIDIVPDQARHTLGSARYQNSGLLDVGSTKRWIDERGTHNTHLPLLLLPAEIRNQIWEYIFNAPNLSEPRVRQTSPRFYTTGEQPPHYFALMQTCRQIYSETALLPLKLVEFYFTSRPCFEWVRKLDPIRQAAISRVRFVTWGFPMHGEAGREFEPLDFVTRTLPVELFPGLRRLVVEVRMPAPFQTMQNHEQIARAKEDIVWSVRKINEAAKVEFQWIELKGFE